MARIDLPGDGSEVARFWAQLPEEGAAYSAMTDALYRRTTVAPREREIARMAIALLNDCKVCQRFRVPRLADAGVDEDLYAAVADWRDTPDFTERERLAAEYAQRFALDHLALDDDFWTRIRGAYTDQEVAQLTTMIGCWLAFGRVTAVLQLDLDDPAADVGSGSATGS